MNNIRLAFDKKASRALKGILVVIMFWSHMFNHPERLQMNIRWISLLVINGKTVEQLLVPLFHVSVPAFFFIAGYGYYISSLKEDYSIINRICGIYIKYWIVFIIFIPICVLFGIIHISLGELLINFIGLSSSYCGEWWFLSTYIEILLVFNLLNKYIIHYDLDTIKVFCLSILISIFGYAMNVVIPHLGLDINNVLIHEIYYLLIKQPLFVLGWCLAKKDYLCKFNNFIISLSLGKRYFANIIMIIYVLVLQYVDFLPETYIYIIYLPIFIYVYTRIHSIVPGIINRIFELFGEYSTYMWLCHSLLLYKLIQKLIFWPQVSLLCWINLVLISFMCAVFLSKIEKKILR